ncbi:MAG: hypothetical protein A3H93_03050 [Rhodocyclales bacterium RIFCSPLOWO2_02_FULL_63_24]|nr:MAG: hypothetical protein A3H93_03050 [Rhodocyclales bacterium RIFCSPLOWO2_02_FULL_63_24]
MISSFAALLKPGSESTLDYAQQVMERTLQLARSQLDVTENIVSTVSNGYRELLTPAEPLEMVRGLSKAMDCSTRSTIEGSTAMLKQTVDYQNELIRMMQARMPELNRQFFAALGQTAGPAIAASNSTSVESAARRGNGGDTSAARSRKAV